MDKCILILKGQNPFNRGDMLFNSISRTFSKNNFVLIFQRIKATHSCFGWKFNKFTIDFIFFEIGFSFSQLATIPALPVCRLVKIGERFEQDLFINTFDGGGTWKLERLPSVIVPVLSKDKTSTSPAASTALDYS